MEASLQNVYDDHRNDAKQNHSIYPDFEATLYEAVGLSKASKARRLVCLMELCRVLDVELPEDDGPHLTQEEKLRILNVRLCERLRPSFVGSRVRKNINRFPMRVFKAAMHILGEVAILALNDEWYYIKQHQSPIWKAIPENIKTLLAKWDKGASEWANRSVHHRRLLNKVDKQIVNKCIFHLFIDYAVEGIISGVSTASHHLHEWSKPKRHRTLARDTIAKILYTVRIEMAPAAAKRTTTTPRAKGGSKVKTPTAAKPSSWKTFKNAVSKTVKRAMRHAGPDHTKRAVHESAKTLRLRTELRKCASKSNTRSSATGTYLFLSALLVAALTLIAARVAKKRGEVRLRFNIKPRDTNLPPPGSIADVNHDMLGKALPTEKKDRCPICDRVRGSIHCNCENPPAKLDSGKKTDSKSGEWKRGQTLDSKSGEWKRGQTLDSKSGKRKRGQTLDSKSGEWKRGQQV